MQTVVTVAALREQVAAWRKNNEKIVFVPTMGNLHAGHLALVQHARKCGEKVLVSIFVNALQFDREEDLKTYPRTPEQDLIALEKENADLIFMPEHEEIYAEQYKVDLSTYKNPLLKEMCGKYRPGFFEGIVEVVSRLFSIVQPDFAVFGEKDYQQLVILKHLVKHFAWPIQIEQVVTQREKDGLALSSRNVYLNEVERKQAPQLYAVLGKLKEQIMQGNQDYSVLENEAMKTLEQVGFQPDYVKIKDANTLSDPSYATEFIAVLAAAWLGQARLIDNVLLQKV